MSVKIERADRRLYFRGNTYPIKDAIKAIGGQWDPDQKAWWVGTVKKAEAEALIASAKPGPSEREKETVDLNSYVIRGRCEITNASGKKVGYYILAKGNKPDGTPYMKCCFRDGSKVFWAKDPSKAENVKMYREAVSINKLKIFAEKYQAETRGEVECRDCARWCTCGKSFCHHHHDGCERCGEER